MQKIEKKYGFPGLKQKVASNSLDLGDDEISIQTHVTGSRNLKVLFMHTYKEP